MSAVPIITALYGAIIGLLAVVLTVNVIRNRVGLKINDGDGGSAPMRMAIRAHANLAQHAPLALLLIGFAETMGTSKIIIHVLGAVLVLARPLERVGPAERRRAELRPAVGRRPDHSCPGRRIDHHPRPRSGADVGGESVARMSQRVPPQAGPMTGSATSGISPSTRQLLPRISGLQNAVPHPGYDGSSDAISYRPTQRAPP